MTNPYPDDAKPTPGSDAAIALGCLCPVFDNNRGKRVGWTGGWIIHADCPVHGDGRDLAGV